MGSGTLLIADIGATHARFALASHAAGIARSTLLPTASFADAESLLAAALENLDGSTVVAIGLAVAGPVISGIGCLTNGSLCFDGASLQTRFGCPVVVLNDFAALAAGLPRLRQLQQIGGGPAAPESTRAVLGPGSGLGMGVLVEVAGCPIVLPSEGGNADLAPGTPLEAELLQILQSEHDHVSWETVLSGPGLVHLYRAVCRLWGDTPQEVTPEWITTTGRHADEPVCHQTLEIFCGLLGAAAGNLALTVCARGGIYIGGGIVPALADFLPGSPLRRRFEERGKLADYVREIPLYLILDPAAGLTGVLAHLAPR